jgi:hypothetical protein
MYHEILHQITNIVVITYIKNDWKKGITLVIRHFKKRSFMLKIA